MSAVPMPTDEKSAEIVLMLFSDFAHRSSYKNNFLKAIDILYGPTFIIKTDSSHRMFFKCNICNKDMNSTRSVADHSNSGTHLKNLDTEIQEKGKYSKPSNIYYNSKSLQFKLQNCSVPVIGLQRVEAYSDHGHYYYKCILCGAHGKLDVMYYHLIGDKHTDKYIKATVVLKSSVLTQDDRSYLRKIIYERERYTVEDIKTIKGSQFYPYKWEEEGKPKKKQTVHRNRESESSSIIKNSRSVNSEMKKDRCDDDLKIIEAIKFQELDIQNSIGAENDNAEVIRKKGKWMHSRTGNRDRRIQVYSLAYWNDILLKFNFVIQTHERKETALLDVDDLRGALNMIIFALHALWFVNREQLHENTVHNEFYEKQKMVLESCLGYVMKHIADGFKKKYGDLQFN